MIPAEGGSGIRRVPVRAGDQIDAEDLLVVLG
jgi:hypothetical protein